MDFRTGHLRLLEALKDGNDEAAEVLKEATRKILVVSWGQPSQSGTEPDIGGYSSVEEAAEAIAESTVSYIRAHLLNGMTPEELAKKTIDPVDDENMQVEEQEFWGYLSDDLSPDAVVTAYRSWVCNGSFETCIAEAIRDQSQSQDILKEKEEKVDG